LTLVGGLVANGFNRLRDFQALDQSVLCMGAMLHLIKSLDDAPLLLDAPPSTRRSGSPPVLADRLWKAAIEADAEGAFSPTLSTAWLDFVSGRLRIWFENTRGPRIYLVARTEEGHRVESAALQQSDAALLARIFCGDQQKALACDLGIATSTVSGRILRALSRLDISVRSVPLALVVAAQAWAGLVQMPLARSTLFEHRGFVFQTLTLPRPQLEVVKSLTRAGHEIASMLIEGRTRSEIASQRRASLHTVAHQIHSIFSALDVTGRFALIRRAIELGCFDD
jgi:DNA-binding NarL/FixJ family response regulator